jgi:hypothetical protein
LERFQGAVEQRLQVFAQQALLEPALVFALIYRGALGHIQRDVAHGFIEQADDLAQQMDRISQMGQGQARLFQILAIGDIQIGQKVLRLKACADHAGQLPGNITPLAGNNPYTANQALLANRHPEPPSGFAQLGKGFVI